jgi:microcystin-dependent protein
LKRKPNLMPFIGEIRAFSEAVVPGGWVPCDGASLQITDQEALFALIGTTYGGNGSTDFVVPDLRGRVPVHAGVNGSTTYLLGATGGAETVNLSDLQAPTHGHGVPASTSPATATSPAGAVPAAWHSDQYSEGAPDGLMGAAVALTSGTGASHDNMLPFQVVSFLIATDGTFPTT